MWFSSAKWIRQQFCFCFVLFCMCVFVSWWGKHEELGINIWSLLPCKRMHCSSSSAKEKILQKENEFSRRTDLYP